MRQRLRYLAISLIFITSFSLSAQEISLFRQYNGRYDFLFFGNTLNKMENGTGGPCEIFTTSSAILNLKSSDQIENAYLYWSGSGTGDFNVKLNGIDINAQRTFSVIQDRSGLPFFSAFTDVTEQLKTSGSGLYVFSDLDLTTTIKSYCFNGTNFGGWAIVLVYKNNTLPLNQLNVYDGLQYVPNEINITLDNLNVIDNQDAKIGFLAWEGDRSISVNETLRINGNPISNPPLNPVDNAFNGTNSFTGSSTLYNMDLDVYNVQNNIKIGDKSAQIQLTSGQDFVMINTIVTKFNSQLPDATIHIDEFKLECDSREILVDYTVFNSKSTNPLPSGTPIAIYANGVFIQSTKTISTISIDGKESNQIKIIIPNSVPSVFDLEFAVDDDGTRNGVVTELNENNNSYIVKEIALLFSPKTNKVPNLDSCNLGFGKGSFDFSNYDELVKIDQGDSVRFYKSLEDANTEISPILNTSNYTTTTSQTTIYIRINNKYCYRINTFELITSNCPPVIYNYFTPNNDGNNDKFTTKGIRDIFINYKITIYNRWGVLIWTGNNNTNDWDGFATKGLLLDNKNSPDGTYYYVIELNDPNYQTPLVGFLYLNK
ncbi:gliding motility-associated C-terminal domain-containing protein [Flavobacterium sp. K5-23]|uniref:gliding motility-associated C-terminal domain-containing protein n=1 Tax=Flavobacterium sp. K5-23 TaxID=2746225 RepID=UPI00200DEDC9|nr:gliding motility-associated C-terminal domain-containing protein [Flavobacterium sp. K5-23]UQD57614.1 gliding motility-associated C-terminal domain-containing protein [Flavobacterium sp. K5-23]